MEIDYSDGQAIEGRILRLIQDAGDRSSSQAVAHQEYGHWPVRYHLCPERANLLRPFNFSGLDVLELGAGMGAVSRWLAEQSKSLHVVEGTQARFSVLSERLKGLSNWTGEVGNFQDFKTQRKFDVVCLVGVLEYSELFLQTGDESPHLWLLKRCREFLKPGGVLVVAIENALGLKYWNGAAEDHRATLFDGICGYPGSPTPRTFSRKELKSLLSSAGYARTEAYYPFPDYKIPTTVVSEELFDLAPRLAAELAVTQPYRDYLGYPLVKYFSDTLATDHLARAGLLADFSNSFLFLASGDANSQIIQQLLSRKIQDGELAWHYAHARKHPVQTSFKRPSDSSEIFAFKSSLYSADDQKQFQVEGLGKVWWKGGQAEPIVKGEALRLVLCRHAYFGEWDAFLGLLESFIRWSLEKWAGDGGRLDGRALDATFVNAQVVSGGFSLFDMEWTSEAALSPSWFVFRNVFNLVREEEWIASGAPFASLSDLYQKLCTSFAIEPNLDADMRLEAHLQQETGRGPWAKHFSSLQAIFLRPLPKAIGPRDPSVESRLRYPVPMSVARLVRAFARRLGLKKKVQRVSRRLSRYADRIRHKAFYLFPLRPVFLPSDVRSEFTASVSTFPRGLVQLRWSGQGVASAIFGFKENGVFLSQRVALRGSSQVLKVNAAVESLTFIGDSLSMPPQVTVRSISRVEAILRLVPFSKVILGLRNLRHLRAQARLEVVEPYAAWVNEYDTLKESDRIEIERFGRELKDPPLISILLPVYNTNLDWLRQAVDSVKAQIYPHWELCIADDGSTSPGVVALLKQYAAADRRIHLVLRSKNGHIVQASNTALALATGQFSALLDHDDVLPSHALAVVAEHLSRFPSCDLVYSDEDKIDAYGRRFDPHFKPDWDPELFYSKNYLCHLSVFRTELLRRIGGFREGTQGSQDYDLILRYSELTTGDRIHHIPQILYHWRAIPGSVALGSGEKNYAHERAREAIRLALKSRQLPAEVLPGFGALHRVKYDLPNPTPGVSVIIPTRDRGDLLKEIASGVLNRTEYRELELLVVDNQTTDPDTLEYFRVLKQDPRVRVLRYDAPFNYSAIVNFGVREARYPLLALLNNDLRVLDSDWLNELVRLGSLPGAGCIGAKLLYPNGGVQHAGVVLGIGGVADHIFRHEPASSNVGQGAIQVAASFSAVSAACLLVKKSIFEQVGGFDEKNLAVAYNDVDFCLKVREAGYRNLWTPYALLEHVESASRGSDEAPTTKARFEKEVAWMKHRWGEMLLRDPAYNPNLTLKKPDGSLAFPPREQPFYRRFRRADLAKRSAALHSPDLNAELH